MKKSISVLVLFALVAAGAIAQQFSFGVGIIGVNNLGIATTTFKDEQVNPWGDPMVGKDEIKYKKSTNTAQAIDFGGFLFFDATYAELSISLGGGSLHWMYPEYNAFKMGLGLLGKFPIEVGGSGLTIAPLLGIDYDIVLGAQDEYGNKVAAGDKDKGTGIILYDGKENNIPKLKNGAVSDFSALSLKLGAEAKFPITDSMYLSSQFLWGIRFNSAYETALLNQQNDSGGDNFSSELFTHGTTFKLAVGFKL